MAQIAEYAHAVHFGDNIVAEIAKAAVVVFITSRADKILRIIGKLDNANPHILEVLDITDLIFKGRGVLKPQYDGSLVCGFGRADIGDAVRFDD